MDAALNPYSPGTGSPPPELAGRDKVREQVRVAIARIREGRAAKSTLLVGLRGVGKTVLLDRIRKDAEETGVATVRIEASENRSLAALLASSLRRTLLQLSRGKALAESIRKPLQALAGFVKLKVKYSDIEATIDFDPEAGLADSGDLEEDLTAVLEQVGLAAQKAKSTVIIFVDELQYLKEEEFAALISALHRCAQDQLPLLVVGAGLPQLRGLSGKAKSYAERLFDFREIGALSTDEAERAIAKPAQDGESIPGMLPTRVRSL